MAESLTSRVLVVVSGSSQLSEKCSVVVSFGGDTADAEIESSPSVLCI